jgi:hypothetical protein
MGSRASTSATPSSRSASTTVGRRAARGVTSLTFDASAPGYQPAWIVDPATAQVTLDLQRYDSSSGIQYDPQAGASFYITPDAGF